MSIRSAKSWYRDAVIGYIICQGFTKKEARKLVRKYGLRKLLNNYTFEQLHYPIEQQGDEIISAYRERRINA